MDRFFYSGPQGCFLVFSLDEGEKLLSLMDVDSSEWTAVEIPLRILTSGLVEDIRALDLPPVSKQKLEFVFKKHKVWYET